jgi:hypothetical protein
MKIIINETKSGELVVVGGRGGGGASRYSGRKAAAIQVSLHTYYPGK